MEANAGFTWFLKGRKTWFRNRREKGVLDASEEESSCGLASEGVATGPSLGVGSRGARARPRAHVPGVPGSHSDAGVRREGSGKAGQAKEGLAGGPGGRVWILCLM